VKKNKSKRMIGITGGIGSGKSVVSDYLRSLGYAVIDADVVAREAVMPGEPALLKIAEAFGNDVISEDGTLNRAALAQKAFANQKNTDLLNSITHEDIGRRVDAIIEKVFENADLVFYDAPLMFETGMSSKCDEVWLITADEQTRLERVMKRDRVSDADIRARMDKQMPEAEKMNRADLIIKNIGTKEDLIYAVDAALQRLRVKPAMTRIQIQCQ
jgi:dephospho-CoA kinase